MNSPEFNRLRNLVNEHILDYMPVIDQKCSTLYDSMRYSLTAGGKRIRPVLMLAAALMCKEKEEIIQISRRIGTYDISIEPYEDCCTVFTPRHPRTRPKLEQVAAEEMRIDFDGLVQEALDGAYRVHVTGEGYTVLPGGPDSQKNS